MLAILATLATLTRSEPVCNDMTKSKVANPHKHTWQPSIPPGPKDRRGGMCKKLAALETLPLPKRPPTSLSAIR
jgi:hypothetical protein